MDSPAGLRAIVLGAITLCIIASITGANAGQEKGGIKIAVFDQERARSEYKYVAMAQVDFQKKLEDTDLRLKTWQQNALLTMADQNKLADLLIEQKKVGDNLDNNKKAELKRLQDESKSLTEELRQLQGNPAGLNADQKNRLAILVRAASDTESRTGAEQEKVRGELQKIDNEVSAKVLKDLREAVNKVAKAKSCSVVFSAGVAWYGETDITDDVVKSLNKN